jgi:ketosteroid isomerase-like protein
MQLLAIRLSVAIATFLVGMSAAYVPNIFFASHNASADEAAREVLSVEREYLRAHTERDVAALERILADDFVIGPVAGRARTKAARLALLTNPKFTFVSIDTNDVKVMVDGDEASVSGRAVVRGRYRGRESSTPEYGFIRSYQKLHGQWQIRRVEIITGER